MDIKNLEFLEHQVETGWRFVMDKLYYPKTHMIYDYLTKDNIEQTIPDLPTPDEIQYSSPNPCGWGTGMEDSTLNLGSMLDAALARYSLTKDATTKKQIEQLCDGLIRNGTAAEPGFIARSICPSDGTSVYIDSSRDQYTNWVYAAHLMIQSEVIDEQRKNTVKEILVNVARKLERDVNSKHTGYLCRLDGYPGMVSEMKSGRLGPHEILRLPMIYMAAYEASGDEYWHRKYHAERDELLQRTEKAYTLEWIQDLSVGFGYIYGIYQAQYSYKLLYDLEEDPTYKGRYLRLLTISAEGANAFIHRAYQNLDEAMLPQESFTPWRNAFLNYLGLYYTKSYCVPQLWATKPMYKWLRNMAEAIIIQCICPGFEIPEQEKEMFFMFVENADFAGARNYWPVLFCDAWWLSKKMGQIP